jgi:hypothetical protein
MALVKRLVKGSPLTFAEGDANLDYLHELATTPTLPYQEFVGKFTQLSTSNPVVSVVSNTFNQTFTWTREDVGIYSTSVTNGSNNLVVIGSSFSSRISDRNLAIFANASPGWKISIYSRKFTDNQFVDYNQADSVTIVFRLYS